MSFQDYRKESRRQYGREDKNGVVSNDELKVGCLLRIADATEVMARTHAELTKERDRYKNLYYNSLKERETLERRVASLKGVITRIKKAKKA